jgi:Tol biopolymer transport system component
MSINRPVLVIIAGAALLCCALTALPLWRHLHEVPPPPPAAVRLMLPPQDDLTLGAGPDHPFEFALAPDGRRAAFPASRAGTQQIWLRDITTGTAFALPGTDEGVLPFWSPDGAQLGFFAQARMKSIALEGGRVTDLAAAPAPRGAVWHRNGDIVFAPQTDAGLSRRRADATIEALTTLDAGRGETAHRFPALTADGRYVIFFVRAAERTQAGIWIAPLDQPAARVRLAASDANAIAIDRWLLYATDDALVAQELAGLERGATPVLSGRPILFGTAVGRSPLNQLFAAAAGDVLLFGSPQPQLRELRWIDRADGARSTMAPQVMAVDLRIAPTGGKVAVAQVDPQLGTLDVWSYEGSRPLPRRISQSMDADEWPVWSPDASRLAWVQARRSLTTRGAMAQLPEQTLRRFDAPIRLWDWSPDGTQLLIGQTRPATRDDVLVVPASGEGEPIAYAQSPFNEDQAVFSPDGKWIAYASDESGQPEIYIDSFPTPGHRARLTSGGGSEPRWSASGTDLFFRRGSEMHAAAISFAGATPEAAASSRLFDAGGEIRAYDVTADGQRFLVNVPAADSTPRPITVVVHWRSLLGSAATGESK